VNCRLKPAGNTPFPAGKCQKSGCRFRAEPDKSSHRIRSSEYCFHEISGTDRLRAGFFDLGPGSYKPVLHKRPEITLFHLLSHMLLPNKSGVQLLRWFELFTPKNNIKINGLYYFSKRKKITHPNFILVATENISALKKEV
jgi:hypothetical protein